MRRELTLTTAMIASVLAWAGPLAVADARGWWWLLSCFVTAPLCEACWRAHDWSDPPCR